MLFDSFSLLLYFLISLIKVILWLKFFYRQKAGGHAGGRIRGPCSISPAAAPANGNENFPCCFGREADPGRTDTSVQRRVPQSPSPAPPSTWIYTFITSYLDLGNCLWAGPSWGPVSPKDFRVFFLKHTPPKSSLGENACSLLSTNTSTSFPESQQFSPAFLLRQKFYPFIRSQAFPYNYNFPKPFLVSNHRWFLSTMKANLALHLYYNNKL